MLFVCRKNRKHNPILWRYIQMCCSEFIGTYILVFLGCIGCIKFGDNKSTNMAKSSIFGYAFLIGVHIFAPISGAHLNPAISVAAAINCYISIREMAAYIIAQLMGSTFAYACVIWLTPDQFLKPENLSTISGERSNVCVGYVSVEVGLLGSFCIEFVSTFILILVYGSTWDKRNEYKTDSVSIRFGFTLAGLYLATAPFTSAQMNPARTFGPAIVSWQWQQHWLFWTAPLTGASFATIIYKFMFGFVAEDNNKFRIY